ncbi:MAG: VCBS repeat-containing protein [Verrucomicrobia bacterium]|nr:VCBS repeat-containing protein [Verrucomicrobiota bacterium]
MASLVADRKTVSDAVSADIPFRHIVIDRDFPMQPHCKTTGDMDGDGSVDVLAASAFGRGVFWYAYPNWTKHRIDSGSFTTDMQVGDIDKDGDLDVIIPKTGIGLVWYENPYGKNAGQASSLPVRRASSPRDLGGKLSLEPAHKMSAPLTWKLHKIDHEDGHDVEVGDVDGDGRLDVVVRHGKTRVFLQINPDSWRKINIPTVGRGGTVLGDLDGDGDFDIAQNGYWLEAPADKVNAPWPRHEIATGWPDDCGVHIVDLNRDGRLDMLMAPAETHGRLSWFEAADPKTGPWKEHVIDDKVTHIHTFKTGDVDRDGNLDVVTAEMEQSPEKRVTVYYNRGRALKWLLQVVGRSGSHNLRLADIGNDGDLDIIGANHGNYGGETPIEFWENLSARPAPTLALDRWQRHVIDAAKPWRAVFIAAADLNGDDRKDIVTGGSWYQNPGSAGGPWPRHDLGTGLNNMAAVYDFDGDGDFDVLGTGGKVSDANALFVWARNDGQGDFMILTNIAAAHGDFLQGIAVAQFAYHRIGVALSWHKASQGLQWLSVPQNPSAETWTWRKISDTSLDEQLSFGHIGSDAKLDLLLGTRWLRNDGASWSLHALNPAAGDPDRNRLADINADGRLDAVVGFEAINVAGKLAWYEQPVSATDTWTEHPIATVVGPMSLDVADLDRDGDLDVVVGEHNYKEPATAKLHVFENLDGKGARWKDRIVSTGDEHHDGAVVVDIDNDGDLDVISIGWSHPRVLLFENKAL